MPKQITLLLTLVLVLLLAACGSSQSITTATPETPPQTQANNNNYPLTIVDSLGREITIEAEPARIVSLSPAITEILFAIGVEDRIIGVTDYCDYPPAALDKPKVGSFNNINMELLVASEPDVVFIAAGIQADFVTQLEELGIRVVTLDAETIAQVLTNI
ncbi:MAG: ABC transporter substrate-binding protein, partial [Clostridia bacterium]|nr:ABC transporter substrate-binding protein [Clostridia bacterium]